MSDGRRLDDHQYTVAGLRAYEAIYGRDFVSPGGRTTTVEILDLVDWASVNSALDVGCGLGGAAFMMARDHGVQVEAVDLSENMVDEAVRRCEQYGLDPLVNISNEDISEADFDHGFDLVHSREVFLHIRDKPALFATLHRLLEAGGQLIFTDYCCGPDQPSDAFATHVTEFGYNLRTVDEIGALLGDAGFREVVATDQTDRFIEIHRSEVENLANTDLDSAEQDALRVGWLAKIDRATRGEQRWGLFEARR